MNSLDQKEIYENALMLEAIFNHTHFMIAYMDNNFNFIRVNKAYAEKDNKTPDFFVGKNHFDLYPHKGNEAIFKNIVETGESYFAYAKPLEHPKLGITYWDWIIQPVKDNDNKITGILLSLTDVTEYKRNESQIQEEQRKFLEELVKERTKELEDIKQKSVAEIPENQADIFDNVNDAVIVIDNKLRIKMWNDTAERIYGWKKEEVMRKIAHEVLKSQTNPIERVKILEYLRNNEYLSSEFVHHHKNGKPINIESIIEVKRNDKGQIIEYIAMNRDITGRKNTERELLDALSDVFEKLEIEKTQLNTVLDNIPAGVLIAKAPSGEIILSNEQIAKIWRYKAVEDMDEHVEYKGFHPDGRPYEIEEWPLSRSITTGEEVIDEEIEILRGDGTKGFLSVNSVPIQDNKGNIIMGVCISIDTTERKKVEKELNDAHNNLEVKIQERTEELKDFNEILINEIEERKKTEKALIASETKFRTSLETLLDAFAILSAVRDDDGVIVDFKFEYINEVGCKLNQMTYEEQIGHTLLELLPEHKSSGLFDEYVQLVEYGEPLVNESLIYEDVFGEQRLSRAFDSRAVKLDDGFAIAWRDVTERRQAEENLKKLVDDLKRSNEELEQFAHVASHDLQEPLRTIASFTQLLAKRYKYKLNKDADEFIDYTVEAAKRMQQMIIDLLAYSRVETRGKEFKLTNTEEILRYALNNLNAAIEENNGEITHDPLPKIMADSGQFLQLFQNLIGNAIKFRRPGIPPKIHISAKEDKENNEYVFSVRDNGIGMEPQYTERIFVIFQRLHTIDKYKGTGIGLAVSKSIIERHGGRIWVESELGEGSTFYFTIPSTFSKTVPQKDDLKSKIN